MNTLVNVLLLGEALLLIGTATAVYALFKHSIELGTVVIELRSEVQTLKAAVGILGRERKSK